MADDRYVNFLDKILQRTKREKMKWSYLDSNRGLYEQMHWTDHSFAKRNGIPFLRPNFDTENSFYCKINSTYMVILVQSNQPASFYVIPDTFKNIVTLTADMYGNYITRLLNLVQSFFPDGESFIDSILQDDEGE